MRWLGAEVLGPPHEPCSRLGRIRTTTPSKSTKKTCTHKHHKPKPSLQSDFAHLGFGLVTEPCHQQKFKIVFPRRFHRPSDIFHDSSPTNWVPSRFGRQRVHPFRLTPVASGNSKSYCICPNVKILYQWIKHVNFHDFSWFLSSIVRLYRLIAWGCSGAGNRTFHGALTGRFR